MLSTMAQSPLTVEQILRYAVDEHGDRSVTTATREGCRKITYSELGNQASRIANKLRSTGITSDERNVLRWWLPERWVSVDEIPRTSVGKYDKKAIRARYADDDYSVLFAHGCGWSMAVARGAAFGFSTVRWTSRFRYRCCAGVP
jgi:acyl-CoA synthetase (AMP-forming)/AMP-acid ligase II